MKRPGREIACQPKAHQTGKRESRCARSMFIQTSRATAGSAVQVANHKPLSRGAAAAEHSHYGPQSPQSPRPSSPLMLFHDMGLFAWEIRRLSMKAQQPQFVLILERRVRPHDRIPGEMTTVRSVHERSAQLDVPPSHHRRAHVPPPRIGTELGGVLRSIRRCTLYPSAGISLKAMAARAVSSQTRGSTSLSTTRYEAET